MANTTTYIDKIVVPNGSDTITANLVDTVSGYTTPEMFKITLSYSNSTYSVDKTWDEIVDAYEAGKYLYIDDNYLLGSGLGYHYLPLVSYDDDYTFFKFACYNIGTDATDHIPESYWCYLNYDTLDDTMTVTAGYKYPAEMFKVTLSGSGSLPNVTYSFDKTFSEIEEAYNNGYYVYLRASSSAIIPGVVSGSTTNYLLPMVYYSATIGLNPTKIIRFSNRYYTFEINNSEAVSKIDIDDSKLMKVTLRYSNSTYSIDSTYDDILQAVSDGKFVYLYDAVSSWSYNSDGGFIIAPLSVHFPYEPAENEYYLYFVSSYTAGGNISFCRYSVDYDSYVSADNSIGVTSATSASSATSATNATNANVTATNPTSGTTYYPPFVSGTGNQGLKQNNGLKYMSLEGTTSANGYGILRLGNTTNSGTAGNKYGGLDIYPKTGAYYGRLITADTLTANRTYTFPDATGTVFLSSNILSGTTAPTSAQGVNGDIYIRY